MMTAKDRSDYFQDAGMPPLIIDVRSEFFQMLLSSQPPQLLSFKDIGIVLFWLIGNQNA